MIKQEDICKRDLNNANVRLHDVVNLLLEIKLDEKRGLQIPTQTDVMSNCCNKLINRYNGLKIEYLMNHTINKDDFEKRVYILLHKDEEILKEAEEIVNTIKTSYKTESNDMEEEIE